MANDIINYLQNWYLSKCDGDWEHSFGFNISTLDNPGWKVIINGEKDRDNIDFELENDEQDWIFIKANDHEFSAYGGPKNLETILQYAKDWLS